MSNKVKYVAAKLYGTCEVQYSADVVLAVPADLDLTDVDDADYKAICKQAIYDLEWEELNYFIGNDINPSGLEILDDIAPDAGLPVVECEADEDGVLRAKSQG